MYKMSMRKSLIAPMVLIMILFSCNSESRYESKLDQIQNIGDTNPSLGLNMLDSIKIEVHHSTEYVQMKYDLLEIRLKDKAYIQASSDVNIIRIMNYFNEHGRQSDRQAAFYYAGCVYRDLHDTPRSMEYFFRAQDLAEKELPYDSTMLRNIYSNLHCLYYNVQDYAHALLMAEKEYSLSIKMHDLSANEAMHMGATLQQLNRTCPAEKYFETAFKLMESNGKTEETS